MPETKLEQRETAPPKTNGWKQEEPHKNGWEEHDSTETTDEKQTEKKGPIRRALPFLFGAIVIAGALYGWHIIQYNKVHEETDDAQIDVDITPILPRVAGYVRDVWVTDNQRVDSNAVLLTIDSKDLKLKVEQAQAGLDNANAMVQSAQAAANAAKANVATAEVHRKQAADDLVRARGLLAGGAMTQQQFDAVKATADAAETQMKGASDQASAAEAQVAIAEAQVKQRQADLDNANLQLSYATITTPITGTVAKKNVNIGEYIQPGQPLMAITPGGVWITANFKETQMSDIHPGETAFFTVDAYPDSTFHGVVQSISPATGAKFSLLPPDNATGNFIKVTQRVPVKILVDRDNYSSTPLRPGMSVDVTINTGK